MKFHIPIKLPSLNNVGIRMNKWKMIRTKKKQKEATKLILRGHVLPLPPLVVTITRIGPVKLDDDNLQGACKYVRDEIARAVGLDDGSDLYTWVYYQRTGKYGVEVEVTER